MMHVMLVERSDVRLLLWQRKSMRFMIFLFKCCSKSRSTTINHSPTEVGLGFLMCLVVVVRGESFNRLLPTRNSESFIAHHKDELQCTKCCVL